MQWYASWTSQLHHRQPDPEHVALPRLARARRIPKPDNPLEVVDLYIQLANDVEADDPVDLEVRPRSELPERPGFPHAHHRLVHDHPWNVADGELAKAHLG